MNTHDWRNIKNGELIPTENYCDQPYVVKTDDGAWLCALTTGKGIEGERGQHVVSMRSFDNGKSWEEIVDIEPANGPESSYSVLLKVASGRIYCFYNHNSDNLRQVKADSSHYENGLCDRVDSLGYYVFKYSDDHGRTWSAKRYKIPVREMEIDRNNPYGGKIRFFWNVGRPFSHDNSAYVPLIKVGGFGDGFFTSNEGVLLKSSNIMTENDPEKIIWATLPEGEKGIRTPEGGGPIAGEHSYSVLSDGSIFCVFRTIDGHPGCTYSRDAGRAWEPTKYMRYADSRIMKHPRAANFAWKCDNGKFLYWFHNHGGKGYDDRNPVWLCGGIEVDSPNGKVIKWSQPEIVLYDDDPLARMSYPDLIEDNGKYFLTETQKEQARVHEIPADFINRIWDSLEDSISREKKIENSDLNLGGSPKFIIPKRPDCFNYNYSAKTNINGFSLELILSTHEIINCSIIENISENGSALALNILKNGSLELLMKNDSREERLTSEPCLTNGATQHIVVNIDAGPRIVSFIVNGRFCDGGETRQFGWSRFSSDFQYLYKTSDWRMTESKDCKVEHFEVYDSNLMTAEAIQNFNAIFTGELF